MKRVDFILIYLTLIGSFIRLLVVEKQASYLAGRASVYAEMDDKAELQANCYAKNGICK